MHVADAMWLSPVAVREAMRHEVFALSVPDAEHPVVHRLAADLVAFFGCRVADDPAAATVVLSVVPDALAADESYRITRRDGGVTVSANTERGLLYGVYAFLRRRVIGAGDDEPDVFSSPDQPLRMLDHWDQVDGTVERGYAGESIFFGEPGSNDHAHPPGGFPVRDLDEPFRGDTDRIVDYGRFLASIGINSVVLNNVNVRGKGTRLIQQPLLGKVGEVADLLAQFGVRTFLSINFAAPKKIGGLSTSDPLDPEVRAWWRTVADAIYDEIPDFGGFLVKADSEGEPGPYEYGRTHADGANMLADALAPHGGLVIWRAFVYNSQQDWRDRSTDRARAAYENFKPLEGLFASNVALQIKFGPIDFQTREPISPLIGQLEATNLIVEFQITAEYLGHQIDVNYPVSQWVEVLRQQTHTPGAGDRTVATVARSDARVATHVGVAAVPNVGMDDNWTGHALAQANLYAFGRLAWDSRLDATEILDEWIAQTFFDVDDEAREVIRSILLTSRETYENYTAPLGVGFMVRPHYHYGVSVNGYEYDRWGTYHFADRDGVGVDRTVATGTGYTGQYAPVLAAEYEDLATVPDGLLLFFHHVPYAHVLRSGKTVIQHIYDTHFAGVDDVARYRELWASIAGRIDGEIHANVAERLERQHANAIEWRDQVNTYFFRMSGVPDAHGRTIHG